MLPPHQGLESRKADSLDMRIGQRLIHQLLIHQHQYGASFVEVPGCPTSGSANFVVRHSDSVGEDPVRNSSQVEIICLLAQRLAEPRHVSHRGSRTALVRDRPRARRPSGFVFFELCGGRIAALAYPVGSRLIGRIEF